MTRDSIGSVPAAGQFSLLWSRITAAVWLVHIRSENASQASISEIRELH